MAPEDLRIALVSGNYNYVRDGANQALNRLVGFLLRAGARVRIYSPTVAEPAFPPTGDLVSLPSIAAPGRPEYRIPLGLTRAVRKTFGYMPEERGLYQKMKVAEQVRYFGELYGLGAAGNSQGDELAAIVYLRLALHLNPDHALALVTLGDIYERLKAVNRAIEVYQRIPKEAPIRPSADIQIGLGLETMERGEEAVKHLETLVRGRPDDVEALTALGNVLRARKRFAEAAEAYTRAIDRIPNPDRGDWTLFYFRGSAFERHSLILPASSSIRARGTRTVSVPKVPVRCRSRCPWR